jgi:FMN-dependent NADH-azoreductase
VADAFIDEYQKHNPEDQVCVMDLFQHELPSFDGLAVQAKYKILHGLEHTSEEAEAWSAVEGVIESFKAAEKYVFAVPMWNFGIPYRLKQYIDLIVQPGYTFSYSPEEGYKGLAGDKPVFVSYARGGEYGEESGAAAFDLQQQYLKTIFGFMGLTNGKSVVVEPTLMAGPDAAQQSRQTAIDQARAMARNF